MVPHYTSERQQVHAASGHLEEDQREVVRHFLCGYGSGRCIYLPDGTGVAEEAEEVEEGHRHFRFKRLRSSSALL